MPEQDEPREKANSVWKKECLRGVEKVPSKGEKRKCQKKKKARHSQPGHKDDLREGEGQRSKLLLEKNHQVGTKEVGGPNTKQPHPSLFKGKNRRREQKKIVKRAG